MHLDDVEMAYCRVLMDEIFGRDNFVSCVIWQKIHARNNSAQHFSTVHDYIVVFAMDRSQGFAIEVDLKSNSSSVG